MAAQEFPSLGVDPSPVRRAAYCTPGGSINQHPVSPINNVHRSTSIVINLDSRTKGLPVAPEVMEIRPVDDTQ